MTASRLPGVLYRACQLAGESIEWLLTGAESAAPAPNGVATANDLPDRVRRLIGRDPKARAAIESFVDLLDAAANRGPGPVADSGPPQAAATSSQSRPSERTWLPILGRSAAGLVHFWPGREDCLPGITELSDLIERHLAQGHRHQRLVPDTSLNPETGEPLRDRASLVQLNEAAENSISEFIDAPGVLASYPDAFALRIDGDSMAPRIADGDIVVLSATRLARDGETAVVKLKGQIGVTCKIIRRADGHIHLIAANEAYETKTHDENSVEWALAVLWRIRVHRRAPAPPPPSPPPPPASHDN